MTWIAQQELSRGGPSCALCKSPLRSSDVRSFEFQPLRRVHTFIDRLESEAGANARAADTKGAEAAPASAAHAIAVHPALFRLKLSSLQEALATVHAERDEIQPKFNEAMQQYVSITETLSVERDKASSLQTQADALKTSSGIAAEVVLAKRTKLEALRRARTMLTKHRVVWEVMSEAARRESAHLVSADAHATAAMNRFDRTAALSGDTAHANDEEREHQLHTAFTSHLLHQSVQSAFDVHQHPLLTSVPSETSRSTRMHLARVHAAFVARRIESVSSMRGELHRLHETRLGDLDKQIRALETHLRDQKERYAQTRRDLETTGYELDRIKQGKKATGATNAHTTNGVTGGGISAMDMVRSVPAVRKRKVASLDPKSAHQLRVAQAAVASVDTAVTSRPHAAYRERRVVIDDDGAISSSPPAASQPHALLPTHRTLLPNQRTLAEASAEREMEDIMANLWQEDTIE